MEKQELIQENGQQILVLDQLVEHAITLSMVEKIDVVTGNYINHLSVININK